MTSYPPAECCLAGVKHHGTPSGQMSMLDDVEIYVAHPADGSTENAILLLTDIFGLGLVNSKLIADQFAANGYMVVVPDLFHGDPVPLRQPAGFDLAKWRQDGNHGVQSVDPIVENCITAMRKIMGVKRLGSAGYCFGAKWTVRYLKEGFVDVGYLAHPSFVEHAELVACKGPISVSAAESDFRFPSQLRHNSEEALKAKSFPWQMCLYSGCEHGYATRGDISRPSVRFAKEQSFLQAVRWFDMYLKQ